MRGQRRRRPIETKMVTVQKKEGTDTLFLFFQAFSKIAHSTAKWWKPITTLSFFKCFLCDFNQNATFVMLENIFLLVCFGDPFEGPPCAGL